MKNVFDTCIKIVTSLESKIQITEFSDCNEVSDEYCILLYHTDILYSGFLEAW